MKTITAMVVDDEALARRGLEIRLGRYDDIRLTGSLANGREAIAAVRAAKPDLIFLDIQMPGFDGFDVLTELGSETPAAVVFVTAFDHFAVKAFDANAIDYILKPINDDRLNDALERVRQHLNQQKTEQQRDRLLDLVSRLKGEDTPLDAALADNSVSPYSRRIAIRDGRKTACVDVSDIEWIDAARDYMCIHANGQTHVLRGTMKSLEETLDPREFVRIHRSTIVNRRRVIELKPHRNGEFFVRLDCDREFKLSRKYKANVDRIVERISSR